MEIIHLTNLTKDHLRKHWHVYAVASQRDFARKVWDSRRLLPFVGSDSAGTMVEDLYVEVADLTDDGVQPLLDKLVELDHMGNARIIRTVQVD